MEKLPRGFVIDPSQIVHLEGVTSMECYARADGDVVRRALDGVSFTVAAGQRFAILGEERFDLALLSEIIANIKPYESGRCSLVGLGMMREKQRILQQVYYVDARPRMYPHMQGISYLTFASRRAHRDAVARQLLWLDRLLEFGLERLCFTYVRNLSAAERALLLMLLALDMRSPLLLFNLVHIDMPEALHEACARLFARLTDDLGKTIVFSTTDDALADRCATDAALLVDGGVREGHAGPRGALCAALDHSLFALETDDRDAACACLGAAFPALTPRREGDCICLYGERECAPEPSAILAALEGAGVGVRALRRGAPSLKQALKEAKAHAL